MTEQEIRIAVAEAMGWKIKIPIIYNPKNESVKLDAWTNGDVLSSLPNYPNSLDAMHEAESIFNDDQLADYRDHLKVICERDWIARKSNNPWPIRATAHQRAEAFLRTLNLWKDTP